MFVIAIPKREEIKMGLMEEIAKAAADCPCHGCLYDRARRRVSLDTFPVKVILFAEPTSNLGGWVGASIKVLDREDGSESSLRTTLPIIASGIETTEDEVITAIRQAVENTLLHELDECWRVDGARPRDPHVGVAASCLGCRTVFKVEDKVERHRHGHR